MRKSLRRVVTLGMLVGSMAMHAQLNTGTITGTVTDKTGASIPNATIVVRQTETNYTQTLKSKADGAYLAEFLPPGPYALKVSAAGFQTLDRLGIVVDAAQVAQVDMQLPAGGEDQVVNVTASEPMVNATNSTLGRVIDNVEVDNLPLVNRQAYQLLNLTPGVQTTSQTNNLGFPEQHTIINGSTDGSVGQVSYYLDGGSNMTGLRNSGNILPNPDAIAEFAVQTNNFSAQYGRTSAGIVSVVTKSGTNAVHGSVFDFERNTALNASTHNSGTTALPLHRHQYGATVGGPVRKDRTFYFGSYAGQRQTTSQLLTNAFVPDQLQRTGNFSENLPTASGAITSCTQTVSAADKAITAHGGKFIVCNPVTRTPFAGNIITSALDPTASAIVAQNVPLPTNPLTNNWTGPNVTTSNTDEYLIKLDHQLAAKQRLTASYFQTKGNSTQLPANGSISGWSTQNFVWRQQNANLSHIWTLGNSAVNQIWASYTRMIAGRVNLPAKSLADFGSDFNVQGPPQLPQLVVAGWFTLSDAISGPLAGGNVYSLRDVLLLNKGRHVLHVGGEASLEKDAQQTLLNDYGLFQFTASTSSRTGNALSDFLLGRPNTMNQDSPVYANANYWNYGLFAQDDFRVTPRLTLNLGLRYDIQTAPTDTQRRTANFQPGVQSLTIPAAPNGLVVPGDRGVPDTGTVTRFNHFSPRIGFALDAFGNAKTIFHGAAGVFFGSIGGNEFEVPSNFQPYAVRAQYAKVVSLTHPYSTDTTDFPGGVSPYPYVYDPKAPRFIKPVQLTVFDPNYLWSYSYQLNFGLEQQFTPTLAMSLNYVGSLNRKLPLYNDINYPTYNTASPASNTTATANSRRPINVALGTTASPTYSNIYVIQSGQTSNYNGLQLSIDKRLTHHVSAKGFYVWSKTLASAEQDGTTLGSTFQDYRLPKNDHQRSDFDMREQMVTSVVLKPDYYNGDNKFVRGVLNGWTVTAIVSLASGQPFTITTGTDTNGDGNNNDRPNIVPGRIARLLPNRGQNGWFDPTTFCAFNPTTGACPGTGPAGSDGTVRPNFFDAPGSRNVDASFFRDIPIHERLRFQFRTEVVNVFNLTNLGVPVATLSSASFGKITGSSLPNRQIQLGARILF